MHFLSFWYLRKNYLIYKKVVIIKVVGLVYGKPNQLMFVGILVTETKFLKIVTFSVLIFLDFPQKLLQILKCDYNKSFRPSIETFIFFRFSAKTVTNIKKMTTTKVVGMRIKHN